MALDKETILSLDNRYASYGGEGKEFTVYETYEEFEKFAQTIYELGVQSERERAAEACRKSDRYRGDYFAELIRRGETK